MDRSDSGEAANYSFVCDRCRAQYEIAGPVSHQVCPLCGSDLTRTPSLDAPVGGVSYRANFETFEYRFLAAIGRAAAIDPAALGLQLSRDLRPLHVPMRRIEGICQVRMPDRTNTVLSTHPYQLDICCAEGLPVALRERLERGIKVREPPQGVPEGELRLRSVDVALRHTRAAEDLSRLRDAHYWVLPGEIASASPVRDFEYYWPIWLCTVSNASRTLLLAVDAISGEVLLEDWQPTTRRAALTPEQRFGMVLGLSILLVMLMTAVSPRSLPSMVETYAAALLILLIGVWLLVTRRLDRQVMRRRAVIGDAPGFHAAQKRLEWRRRVARFGVLAVATYTVLASGREYLLTRWQPDPIPFLSSAERGVDAETVRPWASINLNFLQSPFGVNGRAYIVTGPAPLLGPTLQHDTAYRAHETGQVRIVGEHGYASLAEAIQASSAGDLIRVKTGRHPGGSAVIRHDLTIEGEPGAVITWYGGRGPFIQLGGADTTVRFRRVGLAAVDINSTILGDPNVAYGDPVQGTNPHLILDEVTTVPAAPLVSFRAPGATVDIFGGLLGRILVTNARRLRVVSTPHRPAVLQGFRTPGPLHPGISRATCLICIEHVDEVELAGIVAPMAEADVLFAGSVGHIDIYNEVGNLRLLLVDDAARDVGVLRMVKGERRHFKFSQGVVEY